MVSLKFFKCWCIYILYLGELCTICYDERADVQLLPCKHKDICYTCALRLVTCPVCRTAIESREQIVADAM